MRSVRGRLAVLAALIGLLAGCQTERQPIPVLSAEAISRLPPDKRPRIWKDPDPLLAYPYNIHESDGLSRNPDDCIKWGCVDVNKW
jgi:hypothetical protein